MTEQERQEHIAMLRKRALVPFRMNRLIEVPGGVEWRLMKARASILAIMVVTFVFGGIALFANWHMGILFSLSVTVVVFGLVALITFHLNKGPDQEAVLVFDEVKQVIEAPLAGLEIDARAVTKLAVREVSWERRRTCIRDPLDVSAASGNGDRVWLCVYAFVSDQPHLLFAECWNHAGMSDMRPVLRQFTERLGKRLIEPEAHHRPTIFE